MIPDPQFSGPFTNSETSAMMVAYALAKAELSSMHRFNEKNKYTLASVILCVFICGKGDGAGDGVDIKKLANEALDCFLRMPR